MNQGVTNWLLTLPYMGDNREQDTANALGMVEQWANQSPFMMMFAIGGVLNGPSFPETNSGVGGITTTPTFLVQAATQSVGFIGGTSGTVNFPRAFPNGLLALLPACGTFSNAAVILNIASTTLSGFTLNANNVAGGIDGTLGITYLALGW